MMTMEVGRRDGKVFLKGKTIRHPSEKKDPRQIDTGKIRYKGDASGAYHQFVVRKSLATAFRVGGKNMFLIREDRRDAMSRK